jgi:16S rRNA processing protein RimM
VGRPHGRDGAFWVEGAVAAQGSGPLAPGAPVTVAGRSLRVERRAGGPGRPLVRLSGVADRSAAAALRDERLLVPESRAPLGPDEWLVEDLVGARVEGLGEVRGVLAGASCDLLEVGEEGALVPLVRDAIVRVDLRSRTIEVDRRFLGLDEPEPESP